MAATIVASAVAFGDRVVASVAAPDGDVGGRRIADVDEDGVTIAVAALRRLVMMGAPGLEAPARLFLSGPAGDDAGVVVAGALGLKDVEVRRLVAPNDAPVAALQAALDATAADGRPTLLVASSDGREDMPGEIVPSGGREAANRSGAAGVALGVAVGDGARLLDVAPVRPAPDTTGHAGRTRSPAVAPLADPEVVFAPHERTGVLGRVDPFMSLAAALAHTSVGVAFTWDAPAEAGPITARLVAGQGNYQGWEAALATPAIDTDAATAARVARAWEIGGRRVAQGAFVSLQQYRAEAAARYRLEGQRCTACDRILFPPRGCCPDDPEATLVPFALSGLGRIYARTRIMPGAAPTEFAPQQDAVGAYAVAVIALDEGPKVAAQLCGPGALDLAIDDPVRAVLRLLYVQDGVPRYGFKFRSVDAGGT